VTARRAIVGGFVTIGVGAALLALWATLGETEGEVLPPAWSWVVAAVLAVVWLFTAAQAWVVLFDAHDDERRSLTGALLLSQLGKYVPGGGVVQVTSMVAMSRNERLTASRLSLGLPVVGLSVVAVGGVALAGLSVADTDLSTWVRILCVFGLAAPLVLWRPFMESIIRTLRRAITRIPTPDHLPSQRAIVTSAIWTAVSLTASAIGYAALLQPLQDERDVATLTLAFIVAWAIGFLVLPVPGGLGIREAVLIALIGGATASIVGASLAHRLINIGVELAAVGWHYTVGRRLHGRGADDITQ
jgi:uncharacterized membrane protein YbhN (UPF0104 family)